MNRGERKLIVTNQELNVPEYARAAYWRILTAMLFPENLEAQECCKHAFVDEIFRQFPNDVRTDLLIEHREHAAYMVVNSSKVDRVKTSTVFARKRGMLGAKNVEGGLSGQILSHMLNPEIGTLDGAYAEVIRRFRHNLKDIQEACDQLFPGESVAVPSVSKLKDVWRNYKNISHFWAAYFLLCERLREVVSLDDLSAPCPTNAPKVFRDFLGAAMFFRKNLLEARNHTTGNPYIKDRDMGMVWTILTEDCRPFPFLTCILR